MLSLRALTTFACLTTSTLLAQTTYLSEDFTNGVPPAGWVQQKASGTTGWISAGSSAWHEDEPGTTCDSYLITPTIDLSAASEAYLHFGGETYYSSYLANHPSSFGDGVSTIEITTDGGSSWTVLWTDTSISDNVPYSPNLGLAAYVGSATVNIAIHYYGTFAQEWWIDYLIVDDTPVPVLLEAINPANGHPYTLLGASDVSAAISMAESIGGHLVTISDAAENSWLLTQFGSVPAVTNDFWLGYNDLQLEGTFEWMNGEVTGYENWELGEPNNAGNEDYVQMTSNGEWNDITGTTMGHAIIEISEPSLEVTPLIAGQLATFTATSFPAGSNVVYVLSINGAGPSTTPFGVLEVDLDIISPAFPDVNGTHTISTYIPSNLSGRTVYCQNVVFLPSGEVSLSNPIAEPIQ